MEKHRDRDQLVLVRDLRLRLRKLRQRAGLSQREVAVRMGYGRHGHVIVSEYERGFRPNPSVLMVANMLRAMRCGFIDVLDVMERYTRQPSIPEARAVRALAELERGVPGVRIAPEGGACR